MATPAHPWDSRGEALFVAFGVQIKRQIARGFSRLSADDIHDAVMRAWEGMVRDPEIDLAPTAAARALWLKKAEDQARERARREDRRADHATFVALEGGVDGGQLGAPDRALEALHEGPAEQAREHELRAFLAEHLDAWEQAYLNERWEHGTSGRTISKKLGVSMSRVRVLAANVKYTVTGYYTAKSDGQLCERAERLLSVLMAKGEAGVFNNRPLRLHMQSCEQCALMATEVPRELRAATGGLAALKIGAGGAAGGGAVAAGASAGGTGLATLLSAKVAAGIAIGLAVGGAAIGSTGLLSQHEHRHHAPAPTQVAGPPTPSPIAASLPTRPALNAVHREQRMASMEHRRHVRAAHRKAARRRAQQASLTQSRTSSAPAPYTPPAPGAAQSQSSTPAPAPAPRAGTHEATGRQVDCGFSISC